MAFQIFIGLFFLSTSTFAECPGVSQTVTGEICAHHSHLIARPLSGWRRNFENFRVNECARLRDSERVRSQEWANENCKGGGAQAQISFLPGEGDVLPGETNNTCSVANDRVSTQAVILCLNGQRFHRTEALCREAHHQIRLDLQSDVVRLVTPQNEVSMNAICRDRLQRLAQRIRVVDRSVDSVRERYTAAFERALESGYVPPVNAEVADLMQNINDLRISLLNVSGEASKVHVLRLLNREQRDQIVADLNRLEDELRPQRDLLHTLWRQVLSEDCSVTLQNFERPQLQCVCTGRSCSLVELGFSSASDIEVPGHQETPSLQ